MERCNTNILNKYGFNVKLVGSAMSPITGNILKFYDQNKDCLEDEDDFYVSAGLALLSKTGIPLKLILRAFDNSISDSLKQLNTEKIDVVKYIKNILQSTMYRLGYKDEVHSVFGKNAGANWKELTNLIKNTYIIAIGKDEQNTFSGIVTKTNEYRSVSSNEWIRACKTLTKDGYYWVDWRDIKESLIFLYFKI